MKAYIKALASLGSSMGSLAAWRSLAGCYKDFKLSFIRGLNESSDFSRASELWL